VVANVRVTALRSLLRAFENRNVKDVKLTQNLYCIVPLSSNRVQSIQHSDSQFTAKKFLTKLAKKSGHGENHSKTPETHPKKKPLQRSQEKNLDKNHPLLSYNEVTLTCAREGYPPALCGFERSQACFAAGASGRSRWGGRWGSMASGATSSPRRTSAQGRHGRRSGGCGQTVFFKTLSMREAAS